MRIVNTKQKRDVTFNDLRVGQVFIYHDYYYMVICSEAEEGNEEINAVELTQGELTCFAGYEEIELVDAELIIK